MYKAFVCLSIILNLFFLFIEKGESQSLKNKIDMKNWNGLIVLKSKRSDVEKLLGNPVFESENKYSAIYNTSEEKIAITYTPALSFFLTSRKHCKWDLQNDTIISIMVSFKTPKSIKSFQLNLDGFQKVIDVKSQKETLFVNEKIGFSILTIQSDKEELISSIEYAPRKDQIEKKCKIFKKESKTG